METVLVLDVCFAGACFPLGFLLVEKRGVIPQPLSLVEVGGLPGPILVVALEPEGPLAGFLAGGYPWESSGT